MNSAAPSVKACTACGKEIPVAALICSECSEYQSRWRSEARYFATVAGFITLVVSGVVFTTSALKSSWDYYRPPDLLVLDFDTFRDITLVNGSAQFVFVKDLQINAPYPGGTIPWTPRWDINQSIDPSKSVVVDLVKLADARFRGLERAIFGNHPGAYAQKLSAEDVKEIFAYRRHNDYVPAFLKAEGTEHRHLKNDIGAYITEFSCDAKVSYLFLQSQRERTTSIPCIGVVKLRAP